MACPKCDSDLVSEYDDGYWVCQRCAEIYEKGPFIQRTGNCKIVGSSHTHKTFGTNYIMTGIVSKTKVRPYRTVMINDQQGYMTVSYHTGGWSWHRKDLILVDEDGKEIEGLSIPKPEQFDINLLYT